jgi:prepilin-type processing-associated H-X9-DG protein
VVSYAQANEYSPLLPRRFPLSLAAERRPSMLNRRSAYTLMELLVVLAIVFILAAILFPVFTQTRAKARAATCLSHLRQLGIAQLAYADDYDETLISNRDSAPDWDDPQMGGAVMGLQPYIGNNDVFFCPERETTNKVGWFNSGLTWSQNKRNLGYGTNYGIWDITTGMGVFRRLQEVPPTIANPETTYVFPGRALSDFKAPSETVLMSDTNDYSYYTLAFYLQDIDGTTPQAVRHNGMYHFCYVDGHVQAVKMAAYRTSEVFTIMPVRPDDVRRYCYDPDAHDNEGDGGLTCRQQANQIVAERRLLVAPFSGGVKEKTASAPRFRSAPATSSEDGEIVPFSARMTAPSLPGSEVTP